MNNFQTIHNKLIFNTDPKYNHLILQMSTPYASPHSHQERYEENCNDSLFECEKEDDMQSCPLE